MRRINVKFTSAVETIHIFGLLWSICLFTVQLPKAYLFEKGVFSHEVLQNFLLSPVKIFCKITGFWEKWGSKCKILFFLRPSKGTQNVIRPPDVSREGLKFYQWTFSSFFIFYQSTVLSSHQMYFGGSVIGKPSTVGIEISPTPPLIFTVGQKSAKFGVVFNITQLWAARVWKCSKISERWNKLLV